MRKGFRIAGAAILLTAGMIFTVPQVAQAQELTIPDGVYVGDQNLGGKTQSEASQMIKDYVSSMENQKITLSVDGQAVETTASELGFHWSNAEEVEKGTDVYKDGNIIRRYLTRKDIQQNNVKIPLQTEIDSDKVTSFVHDKCSTLIVEPKDATITRADGKFVITDSVVGKVVDIEATNQALNKALESGLGQPVLVDAVVAESEPSVTSDSLASIQDVLGTFSTDFSSSGASRSTNLKVGSAKINGRVLMPGEVLSGYECMKPFTTANGYATAAAYENGQVVDSVGGGVCQISTTLYNTAIRAELDIVQRQNHSMIVTYVKPSEDAAIAGTYKDLKFKNNYSTPIYVEGYTSGRTLTFTIYGKETRPANRTFKFVSETLGVMDPGEPSTIVDTSLAPGKRVKVQSSHRGYKSRLWKYVYVDGVEQSREIMHTDTYNASKAVYKVGPAVVTPPPTETPLPTQPTVPPETPAPTQAPTEAPKPVEGVGGGPGVTEAPTPAPTQAPAPTPTQAPTPTPTPTQAPAPTSAPVPEPVPVSEGAAQ